MLEPGEAAPGEAAALGFSIALGSLLGQAILCGLDPEEAARRLRYAADQVAAAADTERRDQRPSAH